MTIRTDQLWLCPAPRHRAATCTSETVGWPDKTPGLHSPCGCPQDTAENGSQSTTANNISMAVVRAKKHDSSAGSKDCCYPVVTRNRPLQNKFCSVCSILKGQPFRQPSVTACFRDKTALLTLKQCAHRTCVWKCVCIKYIISLSTYCTPSIV